MNDLHIAATHCTPSVRAVPGLLEMGGDCCSEDGAELLGALLTWIRSLMGESHAALHVVLRLQYLDPDSARGLLDIFDLLDEASIRGRSLCIRWSYDQSSAHMAEICEEFKAGYTFPFDIVCQAPTARLEPRLLTLLNPRAAHGHAGRDAEPHSVLATGDTVVEGHLGRMGVTSPGTLPLPLDWARASDQCNVLGGVPGEMSQAVGQGMRSCIRPRVPKRREGQRLLESSGAGRSGEGREELLAAQLGRMQKVVRICGHYQKMLRARNQALMVASTQDPLTDLPNRRSMLDRLHAEVALAARHLAPFSLAALDIDGFKKVNDTFGHGVGDLVLASIAGSLSRGMRAYDVCARWGGEEFLVLLPETPGPRAQDLADRLRRTVEGREHAGVPTGLRPTVSAGVAEHRLDGQLAETILRADRALYAAKRAGRNRVALAP